jgi:hypothetical protein
MVSRLIEEMTKEGLVLRQRKQYVLLESLAERASGSPRQRNQFSGFEGLCRHARDGFGRTHAVQEFSRG